MRPRTKVLLYVPYPIEESLWTVRLELAGWHVLQASSEEILRGWMVRHSDCVVAMTTVPNNELMRLVRGDSDLKVLLVGCSAEDAAETLADAIERDGPELTSRVRGRLRQLAARKRGPKSVSRLAVTEAAEELVAA
jgi:hypothetical protein